MMRLSLEARAYFSKAEQLRQQAAMKSVVRDLTDFFSHVDLIPYGHCYSWKPALVWTHTISDVIIGISFLLIIVLASACIRKIKDVDIYTGFVLLGITLAASSINYFLDAWSIWDSNHWIEASSKIFTALISIITMIYLFKLRTKIQKAIESVPNSGQFQKEL